jgi:D-tagatose-1,6-bisphosphate aldolase subunit GatZ/KbaZ-like
VGSGQATARLLSKRRRYASRQAAQRRAPAVGVGVVSRQVVDAALELASETEREIMLIASRRQVDDARIGCGYVERWTTGCFARYVRERDSGGRVKLCRDHGGPWQHGKERGLPEEAALASALISLRADVDAGFDLLHIDTSCGPAGDVPGEVAATRLIELYERIARYAEAAGRRVDFEIGLEQQERGVGSPAALGSLLRSVLGELDRRGLPRPRFVVAQTGTNVVEMRNVGEITGAGPECMARLEALVAVCDEHGVALKAHNCDYLGPDSWELLARCGVGAANVAPEYGVAQTRTFLELLRARGLHTARARFLHLAHRSGRWRKWLAAPPTAGWYERAVLAGHYVFSHPEIAAVLRPLDATLKDAVKSVVERHLDQFRAESVP